MRRAVSGVFIVVEGPEGAGKSTLVRRLGARLAAAGRRTVSVREPGGTPAAEAARQLVFHSEHAWSPAAELFLVLAARAELVRDVVRPALEHGETVVLSDRFDLSTMAYQVAGRGLDEAAVRAANRLATGGLTPGLTLVLDVDPAVGLARQAEAGKHPDRMERADAALHARVAQAFREASGPNVAHLDARRTAEQVEHDAWRYVEACLAEHASAQQG